MSKAIDIEVIMDEVKSALQSRLNDKISALNTEKADQFIVKPVDAAAYVTQSLNDAVMAFDPFVFIWLDGVQSQGSGPQVLKKYSIIASILKSDSGQDAEVWRVMMRYSRALEETMASYFAGIRSGFRVTVESLVPVPFTRLDSDDVYRAVGVQIMVSMA